MPFNFSLDDLLDFDEEDDGFPSQGALGAVMREQGAPMKTSASGFGYANQQVSITNLGGLMMGVPLYKDASVATNQEEFILSNLLGSSLTSAENEDSQVGYGFDEYVPSDIKKEAASIDLSAPTGGTDDTGGGTGGGGDSGPPIAGIEFPPNLGQPNAKGLYTMPEPQPPGTYVFSVPGSADHDGARELVGVIYTVAKRWHQTYPDSSVRVGDLNAATGHVSHKKGVDVDITVSDGSAANTSSHTREKSINLGKWFIDTGIIKLILFNDTEVQNAVNAYAQEQGKPGIMKYWSGHNDHFHVRILDDYIIQ